ncbi:MAG: ATPase domain-containing protein [Candidatus Nanoarchaeia archaeon]|jgi:DNA repair protein RadB|nr:ATPase domain-containing protein [Candidatus Nanoarchaeia archaeon]|tara:strand:+ start:34332 stop:34970 length:639 start_codon:yes stop_codon:yes gene_type:complete
MMISTGSKDLDEFLGGYGDHISALYGKAATGKTTCGMLATLNLLKQDKKVIYLDVEDSFSLDRLKQLTKEDYQKYLDNLFLLKIKNFKEQGVKIKELKSLIEKGNFSLVVVDTIGMYYRRMVKGHKDLANNMLISQLRNLKELKIPILITNQVYSNINIDEKMMVGHNIVERYCNCLIELDKNIKRKIKLIKPIKKEMYFEIKEDGIFKEGD